MPFFNLLTRIYARFLCVLQLRTSWLKLNDANLFPGQSSRRFFESDREILHTFYEPLRRPDLKGLIYFIFSIIFRQLKSFGEFGPS